MSLFNLIHKSVVIKFGDCAAPKFDSTTATVFRLTAVDGMGFLELQDVKVGVDGGHETVGEPYWINKDLVVELTEFRPGSKATLKFSGGAAAKPVTKKAAAKVKTLGA